MELTFNNTSHTSYEDTQQAQDYKAFIANNTDGLVSYYRRWEHPLVIQLGQFASNHDVLDVGSLYTLFPAYISHLVGSMVVSDTFDWEDQSPTQNILSWRTLIERVSRNTRIDTANIIDLPYQDNMFDRVMCTSVIEHVMDDRKGMEEMMRVLKPGGLLIITTEFHPIHSLPLTNLKAFRLYSPTTLHKLVDGLGIVSPIRCTEVRERFANFYFATAAFTIQKE